MKAARHLAWLAGCYLALRATAATNVYFVPAPVVTNFSVRAASVVLRGLGGLTNENFTVLSFTNLASPQTNWNALATNTFDASGHFSLTCAVGPSVMKQFYAVQIPAISEDLWVPTCGALLGAAVSNANSQTLAVFENLIGRKDDVLRVYHTPGSWTALSSAELSYINSGRRLLESVKPDTYWSNAVGAANGGSATVDSQMASLAKSVAAIRPLKIMLIVWAEPENDVLGSVAGAKAGTTAQYVAMWHNVRGLFEANGATNVIWCWDVENYSPLRHLLAPLWPGNTNVDWVMWDQYQDSASVPYTNVLQGGYEWMLTNSTSTEDFASKPWGLAEWGVGINSYFPTVADQTNGINGLTSALSRYTWFPRIKLVEYFDEGASWLFPEANASYSNLVNSPYLEQKCPR